MLFRSRRLPPEEFDIGVEQFFEGREVAVLPGLQSGAGLLYQIGVHGRSLPEIARRVEDGGAAGAGRPWAARFADADVRRRVAPAAAVFEAWRSAEQGGDDPLQEVRSCAAAAGPTHDGSLRERRDSNPRQTAHRDSQVERARYQAA